MLTGNYLDVLIPLLVAALAAAGSVVGMKFRDADSYGRRRGIWLLMLPGWMGIALACGQVLAQTAMEHVQLHPDAVAWLRGQAAPAGDWRELWPNPV